MPTLQIPNLSDEAVRAITDAHGYEWNEGLWEELVKYMALTDEGRKVVLTILAMGIEQQRPDG